MDQSDRIAEFDKFKNDEITILVASDVAARGLDVKGVSHVINFDVPWQPDDYVHRIGRTGRAGMKGIAYTLATREDAEAIGAIEKLTGHKIVRFDGEQSSDAAPAAPSAPATVAEAKAKPAPKAEPAARAEPAPRPSRGRGERKPAMTKVAATPAPEPTPHRIEETVPTGDGPWNGPLPAFLQVGFTDR